MDTKRYRVVKLRSSWAVEDTLDGTLWTGMVYAGALQLADHLNRRAS